MIKTVNNTISIILFGGKIYCSYFLEFKTFLDLLKRKMPVNRYIWIEIKILKIYYFKKEIREKGISV